jgi:hypothetical protein
MANYIIRSFDQTRGSIVVEYEGHNINIDLPLVNGLYPTGAELDNHIQAYLPVEWIQRLNTIAAGISNSSDIASLVVPYPTQVSAPISSSPATPIA